VPRTPTALADPDPSWSSYLMTPAHPDYPSAHAVIAGAAEQELEYSTGPRTPVSFTAVIPRGDGRVVSRSIAAAHGGPRSARTTSTPACGLGVHFRFSDEVGASMGRQVGDYDLQRLELPRR